MKYLSDLCFVLFLFFAICIHKPRLNSGKKRNSTLEEINYVDNMLKSTTKEKGKKA